MPGAADASTGARVRRLALEALITAAAVDGEVLRAASHDPDAQVRRIAMRAAADGRCGGRHARRGARDVLAAGRGDDSPAVRLEALRSLRARGDADACAAALSAAGDRDVHVVLLALDQLGACGASPDAVDALVRTVNDLSDAASARGWHRAAHAIVALAAAAPVRGAAALPQFTGSRIWQLRMYAARAALQLHDRAALEPLAKDDDDNVREAAVEGLRTVAGHDADAIYVSGLARNGYQIVRASAAALDGTPHPELAVPALKAAWQRLIAEGRDNSHDARDAIANALAGLAADPRGRTALRQAHRPAEPGRRAPTATRTPRRSDRRGFASPRGAARARHDPRRRHVRAGAVHRAGAGGRPPLRASRGVRATTTASRSTASCRTS